MIPAFRTELSLLLIDLYWFRCISNCKEFVSPSSRLALKGICSNCAPTTPSFKWELLSSNLTIAWGVDTATDQHSRNLVVNAGFFAVQQKYIFALTVTKASGKFMSYISLIVINKNLINSITCQPTNYLDWNNSLINQAKAGPLYIRLQSFN